MNTKQSSGSNLKLLFLIVMAVFLLMITIYSFFSPKEKEKNEDDGWIEVEQTNSDDVDLENSNSGDEKVAEIEESEQEETLEAIYREKYGDKEYEQALSFAKKYATLASNFRKYETQELIEKEKPYLTKEYYDEYKSNPPRTTPGMLEAEPEKVIVEPPTQDTLYEKYMVFNYYLKLKTKDDVLKHIETTSKIIMSKEEDGEWRIRAVK